MEESPASIEAVRAKDAAVDAERKFLEGLLKERFNLFLVSASLFRLVLKAGLNEATPFGNWT